MDGIKRTAHSASQKTSSAAAHRTVQKSTTLNRKFVRRPVAKNTQIVTERKQQQQIANVSVRASQAARRATGTMVNRTQRVKLSPLAKAQQAKAQQQNQQQAQQAQQLKALAESLPQWGRCEIIRDLAGIERVVVLWKK